GYEVHCASPTLARLAPGAATVLYTDLVVREDLLQLVGFASPAEREWHRLLTSVTGVGARASLAILGTLGADALGRALALEDAASIRRAPGVGPKLALRVVNELKGRAPDVVARSARAAPGGVAAAETPAPAMMPPGAAAPVDAGAAADALSALANLGYDRQLAMRALAEVTEGDAPPTDTGALIKAALRRLDDMARRAGGD
ncbi:MAG: Holliday junction branch migration protein RuvA, partial [Pseudomonadota bacterium]